MGDTAIRAENLSKRYYIGARQARYKTLRDTLVESFSAPFRRAAGILRGQGSGAADLRETIWALKDVSLEIKKGESVGIIGRNGAGKSTLLKILSRITEPTEGYAEIHGRVGSLLEVGTGFHPELTGRENIYLNGAILGMTRRDIDRRFDEIVDFAEVERFIDTPVKHYSSGMYLRLAFAVAAHLEPEILLVDEVLAVGDAAFQKKCLGKMDDVTKGGRTVLFVSHNMAAVQNLCHKAILLNQGSIAASGDVESGIRQYTLMIGQTQRTPLGARNDRRGSGKLRFCDFSISSVAGTSETATCGSPTTFVIEYEGVQPLRHVHVSVGLFNTMSAGVLYLSNDLTGTPFEHIPASGSFLCHFDSLPLLPGMYSLNLYCTVSGVLADWVIDAVKFQVIEGDFYGTGKLPPQGYGAIAVAHEWRVV